METLKLQGSADIIRCDSQGRFISSSYYPNLIVNVGKSQVINLLGDIGSPTAFTYLATGSGSTAPALADTGLQSEHIAGGFFRVSASVIGTTTTIDNDTLQLSHTWTASATTTVREIGVFNALSGGTMLCRLVLPADITYLPTETCTVIYYITIV